MELRVKQLERISSQSWMYSNFILYFLPLSTKRFVFVLLEWFLIKKRKKEAVCGHFFSFFKLVWQVLQNLMHFYRNFTRDSTYWSSVVMHQKGFSCWGFTSNWMHFYRSYFQFNIKFSIKNVIYNFKKWHCVF